MRPVMRPRRRRGLVHRFVQCFQCERPPNVVMLCIKCVVVSYDSVLRVICVDYSCKDYQRGRTRHARDTK